MWTQPNTVDRYRAPFTTADAQTSLALAQEKERAATEKLTEVNSRCIAVEASISLLRQEKAQLVAQQESNRRRIDMLEDRRAR